MEQNFAEYPKGIKWTRQRRCVYQVLVEATEPLSAQQIYTLAEKQSGDETYALSTIYRILGVFEENGIVEKTTWMGEDTVLYELERGEHTHYAICLECRKRIPLHSCPLAVGHLGHRHVDREETNLNDFTVVGHKLEIYGYCSACQKER